MTTDIEYIIATLTRALKTSKAPVITLMAQNGSSPFRLLIATMLSLRTKDAQTATASKKLFKKADTPQKMITLGSNEIERLIYPVGFYRTKARHIIHVCEILISTHAGTVPQTMDELTALPGVGRKTANLVLAKAFHIPAICVDTHVHRIMNRIGYVKTKTPEETERSLRKKLPKPLWIPVNDIFVAHGQTICAPISPKCSLCPIQKYCKKVGVTTSR